MKLQNIFRFETSFQNHTKTKKMILKNFDRVSYVFTLNIRVSDSVNLTQTNRQNIFTT